MGRLTLLVSACAAALWLALPSPARAGIELSTEIAEVGPDATAKPGRSGRMLLEGDRLRMEMARPNGGPDAKSVMIYRGDRNLLWSFDDKRHTYTEVDRDRMQALRAKSEAARAQMRAELDKLPPGKREQAQRMLAASDAAAATREPPTIKETGRTATVGGLPCHEVEVSRGGVKESEICVANWKAAGVAKTDLAAIHELGAFQEQALGGIQPRSQGDDVLDLFDGLDGLPVRVRTFKVGVPRTEFRIVKIEHKALDAKVFEPPEGYQKRTFSVSLPGAGRPRGAQAPRP
jgi:hypothetical protein